MWCISREEGCELLAEVHGGKCGDHAPSRTLVGKAFQHRFYWPIALQDTIELVKTCRACQFHAKQIHTPAQTLQMIPPSWPFAVCGLDILGHFPGPSEGIGISMSPSTNSPSGRKRPLWSRSISNPQSSLSSPSSVGLTSWTGLSLTTGPSSATAHSKDNVKILA
jgi:hypothetical protein